jgi:hypothetical protein
MRPWLGRIVLNRESPVGTGAVAAGDDAGEAGERLQRAMLGVIGAFTRGDGALDYRALRASSEWTAAAAQADALAAIRPEALTSREARLAFWINVYNAMVFHAVVVLEVQRSVREVRGFFRRVAYRVGAHVLTADDMEHGILRDNARHGLLGRRPFGGADARRALAVRPADPRIHFAITCGAQSCPPIGVYRASAIESQLDLAARNFLNQEVALDGGGCVTCSRILHWYAEDFAAAGGLGPLLARYLDAGPLRAAVERRARPCDRYRVYDWALQHRPAE